MRSIALRVAAFTQRSAEPPNACVAIPVYNHARTVGEAVRRALQHAPTVIVCDDGSTDGSGDEAEKAGAVVVRHGVNRGKGAALVRLLEEAKARGFRYAISLDADGQHLPEDIPKLMAAAAAEPGALIIGARDLVAAGAPPSSEFGRKFSNFWVWFETAARVDDSQSGFRAYPLPETLELRAHRRRFDFEVEILLHAAWAGLPLRSVPIGVIYPKDRISHFRAFADNARISLLNTLTCLRLLLPLRLAPRLRPISHQPGLSLFALRRWALLGGEGPRRRMLSVAFGLVAVTASASPLIAALWWVAAALFGLGALPAIAASFGMKWLLGQGLPAFACASLALAAALGWGAYEVGGSVRPQGPTRWTGRSRGGVLGHWLFFQVTRWFGISAASWLLSPVALYFLLVARAGRNASIQFLDRSVGPARGTRRLLRSYQHFLSFARTLLDRVVLATHGPERFSVEEHGLEHIRAAAADGHGAILLTAHVGNWDVAAAVLGTTVRAKIAIVAFRGEQERLARFLEKAHGEGRPRVLAMGDGLFTSLEMVRALREGTLVAVQGDRPVDERVVGVPFLGREAAFPVGPFMVAAVSGAPVIPTFSIRLGPASYRFFALPPMHLSFSRERSRDAQLREWVEQYVCELESLARGYPYQWFNFYDFWDAEPPLMRRTTTPEAAR
jgi:predicted LPLAT superfamily acyltransferase